MIDLPNDYDEFNDEVIYPQGSTKLRDVFMDYDWDLDRTVEYESPLKSKEILSPGNNSSHWNRNNSSVVMMIDNHQTKLRNLKDQTKKSR